MSSIAIIASGAISGLGEGAAATTAGEVGHPARVAIGGDEELARAGLARSFASRAWPLGDEGRAAALLERALVACASDLDRVRSGWRDERVGLVLGTSSGGMRAAERAFADLAAGKPITDRVAPTYAGPLERGIRTLRTPLDPCILVLGACASAALSVGLGVRWLERGACDLVIAGGFDEVTVFVAAGFEALRATTASPPPRPFRAGRDGMSLGEGAAVVALVRAGGKGARAFVTGFGATSDAVHLTAPDRAGAGLARAAKAALAEAGSGRVDLVSAHGTATPFNDAAEARAIASVLGEDLEHAVVHPFKAQVGHTLGAAGAIELLASVDALGVPCLDEHCPDGESLQRRVHAAPDREAGPAQAEGDGTLAGDGVRRGVRKAPGLGGAGPPLANARREERVGLDRAQRRSDHDPRARQRAHLGRQRSEGRQRHPDQ